MEPLKWLLVDSKNISQDKVSFYFIETCKVMAISSLIEKKRLNGVEDKNGIPRRCSTTRITNYKGLAVFGHSLIYNIAMYILKLINEKFDI
jgi:hypothetical protein